MERSRKRKILLMLILGVTIAGLSIGFAAFSGVLNISSSANVSVNSDTFSVKFSTNKDSLIVNDVEPSYMSPGISANAGVIDNSTNPTITNLSATFTEPGQYVEYTFYARNEGEYTAYLNSINYFGEKLCESSDDISSHVQSACDSIVLKVYVDDSEYVETTEISSHSLEKNTGEEIRIVIDYPSTGGWSDAPFTVTFPNIMMIYSTINDSTFIPSDSPINYVKLFDIVSKNAVVDSKLNFSSGEVLSTINNIAYIRSGTENNTYPIFYYRGNVTQNNVRFANFCWKIVRTTETGGVKLIYNGVPAEDGSCDTLAENTYIERNSFAGGYSSVGHLGYMYGKLYYSDCKDLNEQSEEYLYGNDVVWDGENYNLKDSLLSNSYINDKSTIAERYHYTCFNDTGICNNVYYIQGFEGELNAYRTCYTELTDGVKIDEAINKMFENTKSSKSKTIIDNWYLNNMNEYTFMLEDTVWCNDRTIHSGTLLGKDSSGSEHNYFASAYRNSLSKENVNPSLSCSNIRDSFTVNSANGNGKLTYPVGLLTADELTLAGNGRYLYSRYSYLSNGYNMRTMTPYSFSNYVAMMYIGHTDGNLQADYSNYGFSIRPVVSVVKGTRISGGDGTVENPYIVE